MNDFSNKIIGCRSWFVILKKYLLFCEAKGELDDIDRDILNWCTHCLDIMPDIACDICQWPTFESVEYEGVCKCKCYCDYFFLDDYACKFCHQIVTSIHMLWK